MLPIPHCSQMQYRLALYARIESPACVPFGHCAQTAHPGFVYCPVGSPLTATSVAKKSGSVKIDTLPECSESAVRWTKHQPETRTPCPKDTEVQKPQEDRESGTDHYPIRPPGGTTPLNLGAEAVNLLPNPGHADCYKLFDVTVPGDDFFSDPDFYTAMYSFCTDLLPMLVDQKN